MKKKVTPPDFSLRYADLGPLQELLVRACPADKKTGVKSVPNLARKMKLSPWAVYKWVKAGRIPPRRATQIVELAEGRVTLGDFSPFVYW